MYDYEADILVSHEQSIDVLESLVDPFLSDVPKLKEHPILRQRCVRTLWCIQKQPFENDT
jgi:hypothetical protein